jgi:hypothetical protein
MKKKALLRPGSDYGPGLSIENIEKFPVLK